MVFGETAIIDVLTKGLAGQAIKSGWDGITKNDLLQTDVGDLLQAGKYLFFREYAQRYWNRHGQVRVLKMSRPMNLELIYITVKGLDQFRRERYANPSNLEQAYRESGLRRYHGNVDETELGITFANQEQYLMVFGEPGIGKSTFLRKVGLEAMKGNAGDYAHNLTPVLLELKEFTGETIDILQLIKNEFLVCRYPNVDKAIPDLLKNGKLLILLDGLDEVPKANLNNVVTTIQNFVDQHQQNRFIISCRTAARTTFRLFRDIEILEFDDEQIESFIYHWFSSDLDQQQETAKQCWELLQQEEYKSARELAHTPLLLTFLCLVYDESQAFPPNRSRLYQDALRILLERWAAEKRLPNRRTIHENLNTEQEEILLSEVAYQNFKKDCLFFEKRDLTDQIKAYFVNNLNAPPYQSGEDILMTIEREQGIFVERARGVYSFSHLTLQEYLTAQYIVDNENTVDKDGNSMNLIEQTVKNYLTDPRWKEVFILMAGLMRGKADRLLLAMERQIFDFFNTELGTKLIPILEWADRTTKDSVESPIKPIGRRAIVYNTAKNLIQLIHSHNSPSIVKVSGNEKHENTVMSLFSVGIILANDHSAWICKKCNYLFHPRPVTFRLVSTRPVIETYFYVISELHDIVSNFCHQKIFNDNIILQTILDFLDNHKNSFKNKENLTINDVNRFSNEISSVWFETCLMHREWTTEKYWNLSADDYSIADMLGLIERKYFYINSLILDCKAAAPNLSPSVWEGLEERMLKPPANC